jgi:two-component system chemotaxis response regulator CheY
MAPLPRSALVVGDSALLRTYVSATLKTAGFTVVEAANGFFAMDRISERSFDLCFIDLDMPQSDGMAIFALTLTGGYRNPIPLMVGCSAKPNDPPRSVWTEEQALSAILPKPFRPQELMQLLASHTQAKAKP